MKILVVGGANHYASIFKDYTIVHSLEDADLVFFTGGADVNPELYGEERGIKTQVIRSRDVNEELIFKSALALNKKMIGVCRGSQFLTVMSGAKLIQDVNNHAKFGTHKIKTIDGDLDITSTHHQMMYPYNLPEEDYLLIGWMEDPLSTIKFNGDDETHKMAFEAHKEPEIVRYHKTNCLCIQGHPEMQLKDTKFIARINDLISKYLLEWND